MFEGRSRSFLLLFGGFLVSKSQPILLERENHAGNRLRKTRKVVKLDFVTSRSFAWRNLVSVVARS